MNITRNAYFKRLQDLSDTDNRVLFVSADCAGLVFDDYRKTHAANFINVGIAEQNMVAVACGLALAGKRPITYGHAPFSTTRALDQLRNCAALMRLPVSIVVNGVGFAQPYFGATHFNTEDLYTVSLIPGIQCVTPSSPSMGIAMADYALAMETPLYVRFDPYCDEEIYLNHLIDLKKGFEVLRHGKDVVVITNASYTHRALALAEDWYADGIDAMVIDVYGVPFDGFRLIETIGERPIVAVDEQTVGGSIGIHMLRELNTHGRHNIIRMIGIDFGCSYPDTSSRSNSYFSRFYGLTDDSITSTVTAAVAGESRHL